ncbi:hypothetical protein EVA_16712, partial [gut metagenome]
MQAEATEPFLFRYVIIEKEYVMNKKDLSKYFTSNVLGRV